MAAAFTIAAGKGELDAVIYNAGNNPPTAFMGITPEFFQRFCAPVVLVLSWLPKMLCVTCCQSGKGTVLFSGALASLRGKAGVAHFALGCIGPGGLAKYDSIPGPRILTTRVARRSFCGRRGD